MPDLMDLIATDAIGFRVIPPAPSTEHRRLGVPRAWSDRVSLWLKAATNVLDPARPGDRIVDAFADVLAHARDIAEVRVALVGLAACISGALRVELFRAHCGRTCGPMATWPPRAPASAAGPSWTEHRGRPSMVGRRVRSDRPECVTHRVELRTAGEVLAILHLTPASGSTWPPRVTRVLESLAAMAACAERWTGASSRVTPPEEATPEGMVRGEKTLEAFLQFAVAQARRRQEPLSLLDIQVDRLGAIQSLLGDACAEEAVTRVAQAVRDVLRASDVVARLDRGRLVAILPTASIGDAKRVAEAIRSTIARIGAASEAMPQLTVTLGVAGYPYHAGDATSLRAAASSALRVALSLGNDRVGMPAEPVAIAP